VLAFGLFKEERQMRGLLLRQLQLSDIGPLLHLLHRRNLHIVLLIALLLIVNAADDIHQRLSQLPASNPPAPQATEIKPAPIASEKPLPSLGLPFSDITEFNEKDSREQAYIDLLKERYEAWLVTYFYLQKCGKSNADDLGLIRRSLQKELQSAHADNNVEQNIISAATGSYSEMYQDIPCDEGRVITTKRSYDANMQQLRTSSSPVHGFSP